MRGEQLKGKVAIVTGASSGVGWQSALRLAEAGVRLCVTARRREALEMLRAEIERRGGECLVSPGDVTVDEDVARVVRECIQRYGRVDLLVNNAAVQSYGYFEELPWDHVVRTMDVTFLGYLRFARRVLPHLRRQGNGHIINVLSMLSRGAAPLLSAYTAAKHALYGWSESLKLELHGSGIEVSGILVPSVATPMFDHAPTMLDRAPRPVPPTYDPDVAARSVLRAARRPGRTRVPVFLQGRLVLWVDKIAPAVGRAILGRWGVPMQLRPRHLHRRRGNLFEPTREGVGPYGSVPPTSRWLRLGATLGLVAVTGAVLGGAAFSARALAEGR